VELPLVVESRLHDLAEWLTTWTTVIEPTPEQWNTCRVFAHRGLHDDPRIPENTMASLAAVLRFEDIHGVEFDVRWTKDLVPMVFHDPDLQRVFGSSEHLADLTSRELRQRFPLIPTLPEVVQRLGKHKHLMIEIKEEHYPEPERQLEILQETLEGLIPGENFHFLLLDPATYEKLSAFPKASVLLVGGFNVAEISEAVSTQDFGGIGGQYLLMPDTEVWRHLKQGKIVGTGYPRSWPALCRELSRGVTYLFSNQAQDLAKILAQERLRLSLDPH
jgi:glycerophosphoryl diester phosphodiesterase